MRADRAYHAGKRDVDTIFGRGGGIGGFLDGGVPSFDLCVDIGTKIVE